MWRPPAQLVINYYHWSSEPLNVYRTLKTHIAVIGNTSRSVSNSRLTTSLRILTHSSSSKLHIMRSFTWFSITGNIACRQSTPHTLSQQGRAQDFLLGRKGFPIFSAIRMVSPDTIILLIVDYHADIGGKTSEPPPPPPPTPLDLK